MRNDEYVDNVCSVPKCKGIPFITYYRHRVCRECWEWHCDEEDDFNLKEALEIEEEEAPSRD